jgi:hypothetical protein
MGIFGYSMPPGCNSTPYDDEYPCEVCGRFADDCICPECRECEVIGAPKCYEQHGMVRNQEQIDSLAKNQAQWDADNEAMNKREFSYLDDFEGLF